MTPLCSLSSSAVWALSTSESRALAVDAWGQWKLSDSNLYMLTSTEKSCCVQLSTKYPYTIAHGVEPSQVLSSFYNKYELLSKPKSPEHPVKVRLLQFFPSSSWCLCDYIEYSDSKGINKNIIMQASSISRASVCCVHGTTHKSIVYCVICQNMTWPRTDLHFDVTDTHLN